MSDAADRYVRQSRFAPLGREGQQSLAGAHVLIVGVGALGSHSAESLWRAGVGRLTLVDRDVVEFDNLPRQVLFDEQDALVNAPKAAAAATALRRLRSDGELVPLVAEFDVECFESLGRAPDLLIDGTDNFATRYLLNDLAVRERIPWIYGGVVGAHGRAAVVRPGETPCLRCLMPAAPPAGEIGTCETIGVLEPAVAVVAAFQAIEAVKLLAGRADTVTRGLLEFDLWNGTHSIRLRDAHPDPECTSCGLLELPALRPTGDDSVTLCGRDAVQVRPRAGTVLDLDRLADRLRHDVSDLERSPHGLRFTVEGCRFSVFPGGRALLFGVRDPVRARSLYDRWIGAR